MTQITTMLLHNYSPRAKTSGMQSQVVLGSITTNKTNRGDGSLVALFQILKDCAVKVLYSVCQQIYKTQNSGYRTGKGQFSLQSQRKTMTKNVPTAI